MAGRRILSARALDVLGSLYQYWGGMFGGDRDLASVLGYKRRLEYYDYLARYARGNIARPIVDIPAKATWDTLPRLTNDFDLKSENGLSKKFLRLNEDLGLRRTFEKVDRLAGIGRYAVLLIGFRDGLPLDQPVGTGLGAAGVLHVTAFSEPNAYPCEVNMDPSSEEFGRPLLYEVDFSRGLLESDPGVRATIFDRVKSNWRSGARQKVHASRIVHIAEGTLEDDLFGTPRLRLVWDLLDDLAKVTGGGAEVFWMTANRGLQFDVDPTTSFGEKEKAELLEQIKKYRHGQAREFRTRGVDIKGLNELGAGNVNPQAVFRVLAALITGATGIPYRMLFGTERGQNTSSQDRKAWLEEVWSRRESFANEVVLRPFVKRLVHAGVLPMEAQRALIVWPPVHDDMHQAEVADKFASAEFKHAKAKQAGGAVIGDTEFRSTFFNLPPKVPSDANDLEEREAPAVEQDEEQDEAA